MEEWGGQAAYPLPLPAADYWVRYCARGMQHGSDLDTSQDPDRPADSYSLTFWPAPPAPDQVVKQTSDIAAYWHATARSLTEEQGQPPGFRRLSAHTRSGKVVRFQLHAVMNKHAARAGQTPIDRSLAGTWWTTSCAHAEASFWAGAGCMSAKAVAIQI